MIIGLIGGLTGGMVIGSVVAWIAWGLIKSYPELVMGTLSIGGLIKGVMFAGIIFGLLGGLSGLSVGGISTKQVDFTMYPGERISSSTKNFFHAFLLAGLSIWLIFGLIGGLSLGEGPMGMLIIGAYIAPSAGLLVGLILGGLAVVQHYTLRTILTLRKILPFRIPPFLDHCVDLIFLRRVGGGYIFVHRLLMEHFAEMYVETPTSKGNQK